MHRLGPHAWKKGSLGLGLGVAVGELAVPVIFKAAKYMPRRLRRAIHRYSPSHNKSLGVSAMSIGMLSGNPIMFGAGAGLVVSDAIGQLNREKKMMRYAASAISSHPPIDLHRYEIPNWWPLSFQYSVLGDKLREIVCEDTFNRTQNVWIPAGREHPSTIVTARRIIQENGIDGHNKLDVLRAIQNHISSTINYCYDTRFLDLFVHPYIVQMLQSGDCDDQTLLACSLGEALGVPMRMKLISQYKEEPRRYNHIFSQGEVTPGNWVSCETIFKGVPLGWEAPSVGHRIINLD